MLRIVGVYFNIIVINKRNHLNKNIFQNKQTKKTQMNLI